MIAATILAWLTNVILVIFDLYFLVEGLSTYYSVSEDHPVASLFNQFFGGLFYDIALICAVPVVLLCVATGLLLGRWTWSKLVYAIVVVIIFMCSAVASQLISLFGLLAVALVPAIFAAILMWLDSSKPYFKPRRVVLSPEEPTLEEDRIS